MGTTTQSEIWHTSLMLGLTDYQLKIVMNAARLLPVEKRDVFLQRIAAVLAIRGARPFHRHRCGRRGAVGAGRPFRD
ncbi:MAG: hypothetical protein WCD64_21875 [Pseudolabrys sp.]